MTTYCVKVREIGKKKWAFLTPRGGTNFLRIHASEFSDQTKATACAADINENNPGEWEAKVEVFAQDVGRGKTRLDKDSQMLHLRL